MDYKGKYQRRLIVEALRNDTVAVKAARQSGKSFIASIIATAYLLLGKSVIIALPTLTQGTRLIFGQVRRNIMKLQRYRKLYPAISLVKNTQYELVLANGGKITVLSTSDNANREGYTASLLIIDEAHDAKSSVLEDLSPMLNVAREHDEDRIILLGHGGAKKSLIEIATKERGFHSIVIDCYEVVEDYPPYQNVIDKDKRILSDAEFKVHYECKEIMVGATKIIPHIKLVEPIQGFKSYIHGIDVGGTSEHSDWTYCIRLEQQNDKLNIVGKIKLRNVKALEEADILVKYIDEVDRYHGACGIEINGIGHKLRDIIQAKVLDIRSITMSNAKHKGRKYHLIRKLQKLCIDGKITSSDSEIKNELESLSVMVDDDGITTYEHSDVLSALLIALTCTKGLNEIFSV
jgi:hypothetical protein